MSARRRIGRGLAIRVIVAAGLAAGLLGARATAPAWAGAPGPGSRVSVGLFGDSVTESVVIPDPGRDGLAPQLLDAETHLGFSAGGAGLIAANDDDWHYNAEGILGVEPVPALGWALVGGQDASFTEPGTDGPSGYSAVTTAASATATTTVSDPLLEVLYTSTQIPCAFQVTSGTRSWSIDTYRLSIEPEAAEAPITLGPGSHRITVHGSDCGGLTFDGVVAQRPVRRGTIQMQVDNDGHAARQPSTDLSTRVEEAILERRYRLSVFLYGYIGELTVSPGSSARVYERALLTRAELARMNGGRCLIVAPTPLPVSRAETDLVAGLERHVAARAGCDYTTALTHLWASPTAGIDRGLVVIDGVHPTAAGYRLIAHVLAPVVARLAR